MAKRINVPDSAYSQQTIILSGQSYNLTITYNTSDNNWYLNISNLSNTVNFANSVKCVANFPLTKIYNIPGGNLYVLRKQKTFETIARENFGDGKAYELWWLTDGEEINKVSSR